MLQDEDIVGNDEDEDEAEPVLAAAKIQSVPDKWKKLEADLKRIRERET